MSNCSCQKAQRLIIFLTFFHLHLNNLKPCSAPRLHTEGSLDVGCVQAKVDRPLPYSALLGLLSWSPSLQLWGPQGQRDPPPALRIPSRVEPWVFPLGLSHLLRVPTSELARPWPPPWIRDMRPVQGGLGGIKTQPLLLYHILSASGCEKVLENFVLGEEKESEGVPFF